MSPRDLPALPSRPVPLFERGGCHGPIYGPGGRVLHPARTGEQVGWLAPDGRHLPFDAWRREANHE